jgi:heme exporter protein D
VNPFRLFTSLMGFLAAVLGIARDDQTLVWIAIGLLGTSLAVRIIQKIQQRRQDRPPDSGQSGG